MAKQLTRREFMQVTALGASAGLLAACVAAPRRHHDSGGADVEV